MTTASLVVGGILAVPSLLIQLVVSPLVALTSLPALALLIFRKPTKTVDKAETESGGHVVISGGSSGIGLAVAQECVKSGIHRITLLARNMDRLKEAKASLETLADDSTKIDVVSVDVTDPKALDVVAKKVCGGSEHDEAPVYLFNCAGIAYPGYFSKMERDVFAKTANLNLLGTMYTTHAFLPYMKRGTIVLTSSMGGQCGVFGYTAYAPTKIALKGFAEALHMELINSEVNVQVVYPPDTDTPGYAEENKLKPKECFLISESVGVYKPDVVGRVMAREAVRRNPRFMVYYGLEGWILSSMTAGFGPETSLLDALSQVTLNGLLRLVSFFYLNDFWNTIRKCAKESEDKKDYGSMQKTD